MSIDVVVVLCGGAGERLWPASHPARPKPLVPFGGATLLARTLARFAPLSGRSVLVCGAAHRAAMHAEAPSAEILVEGEPRGTGAAIARAAAWAAERLGPDALVLVTPADHVVDDPEALRAAVLRGEPAARDGALVIFGIVPDRPHPGYGYIGPGAPVAAGVHRVSRFTEKPPPAVAQELLAAGYLWNAGVFLFSVRGLQDQLRRFAPGLLTDDPPAGSFDVGVAERTDAAVVVPVDCGWSDVGTWAAVARRFPSDPTGQTFLWAEDLEVRVDPIPGVGVAASARGVRVFRLDGG